MEVAPEKTYAPWNEVLRSSSTSARIASSCLATASRCAGVLVEPFALIAADWAAVSFSVMSLSTESMIVRREVAESAARAYCSTPASSDRSLMALAAAVGSSLGLPTRLLVATWRCSSIRFSDACAMAALESRYWLLKVMRIVVT